MVTLNTLLRVRAPLSLAPISVSLSWSLPVSLVCGTSECTITTALSLGHDSPLSSVIGLLVRALIIIGCSIQRRVVVAVLLLCLRLLAATVAVDVSIAAAAVAVVSRCRLIRFTGASSDSSVGSKTRKAKHRINVTTNDTKRKTR